MSRSEIIRSSVWRPRARTRVVAIAIAQHDGRILVFEVLDDDGCVEGWRPLGGGVKFMEPAAAAVKREVREEIGCDVEILGRPIIVENMFMHHGAPGHEIIFAFHVRLLDSSVYTRRRLQFTEDDGSSHWAEWVLMEAFARGEAILYPKGLLRHLISD